MPAASRRWHPRGRAGPAAGCPTPGFNGCAPSWSAGRPSTAGPITVATLARVATVIGRLFHLRYTPRGTAYLLHRMGWSPQVPRHRAAERRGRDRPVAHPDLGAKVRG